MRNIICLTLVALGVCTRSAGAQGLPGGYNPANQPAVSPYLQLLRRDSPEYLNYFGLTQPQMQFSSAIQGLAAGQAATSAQQSTFQNLLTLPATGHATGFMTHMRYFNTNGGAGGMLGMGGMGFPGGGLPGGGLAGGGLPGGGGAGMPGAAGGAMPGVGGGGGMPTAPR